MSGTLKDIKLIALQMETDGIKFYYDLASRTIHPMGKAMFKSFAEDEKGHAKRLRVLLPDPDETNQVEEKITPNPGERLASIFQKMGDELRKKAPANTSDREAVKLAIGIEEEGVRFYEQAARNANSTEEREIYHFLAGEERTHLSILRNTLDYLDNRELRDAENEGRIYDMWMNMVNKKL